MPHSEQLVLVDRADATATVTLHRPDALNALTADMLSRRSGDLDLSDGVAYEAATTYPITDSESRVAAFR